MRWIKFLLVVWLTVFFNFGFAQQSGKFRFTIGMGTSESNKFPVYYFEPSRRIQKNVILGARFELHNVPNVEELFSYTFASHYYFPSTYIMNKSVRFFAGLGFGCYSAANRATVISYTANGPLHTYVEGVDGVRGGFYPRVGLEFNRFAFSFEYNFIYRREVRTNYFLYSSTGLQTWSTPYVFNTANYASFKLSYYLGARTNDDFKKVEYDGQNFRKLRLGFGLGYADLHASDGQSTKGAIVLYAEPSYRIRNEMAIGIRLELVGSSTYKVSSQGITGQYYFSNRNFRPFAGVGLSLFQSRFSDSNYVTYLKYYSSDEQMAIGIYPRIGFDAGHFSCTIDWNFVSPAPATINNFDILNGINNQSYRGFVNGSYLSIKGGVFIGGGRKKVRL
ncbi:MAG: hypothetical protein ACK47E_16655 [Cyclobacteriaceae bacterium]